LKSLLFLFRPYLFLGKFIVFLYLYLLEIMLRTVYTPDSNTITFPIPDKYIGTALEINVFPVVEIYTGKETVKKSTSPDPSFGAWADMEMSDEEETISKKELLSDLEAAFRDVKLMIDGKKRKKSIEEFLNEL